MEKLRVEYFNSTELLGISNALLLAIENCNKAYALVNDRATLNAIDKETKFYLNLNERVCRLNELLYGEPLREEV